MITVTAIFVITLILFLSLCLAHTNTHFREARRDLEWAREEHHKLHDQYVQRGLKINELGLEINRLEDALEQTEAHINVLTEQLYAPHRGVLANAISKLNPEVDYDIYGHKLAIKLLPVTPCYQWTVTEELVVKSHPEALRMHLLAAARNLALNNFEAIAVSISDQLSEAYRKLR